MTHVDEGLLQALEDGELAPAERERVELHLASCIACRAERAELKAASATFAGAMAVLDGTPARGREYGVGWPRRLAPARSSWWSLPRAAVLVLGFAAAASATLPGSPVRRWLEGPASETVRAATDLPAGRVAAVEAAPPVAEVAPEAGVSVPPLDGVVRIELRGASPELRVSAAVAPGERAGVYATGGAASARFATGPGRIEVEGVGTGELRIELPRAASSATVTVDGEEYLRKEGDRLLLLVGDEHRAAAEVNFRIGP